MWLSHDYHLLQAKALREHSSTRIKLSVSLNAPEITLPLSATSSAAIVVDLGTLTISNKYVTTVEHLIKDTLYIKDTCSSPC